MTALRRALSPPERVNGGAADSRKRRALRMLRSSGRAPRRSAARPEEIMKPEVERQCCQEIRGRAARARALKEMAVFASVADALSFTAAARALGITTSAVSKCVARLEGRLGVRLLSRTTARVAPTDAGRTFHEHCKRILREIDEAESVLCGRDRAPRHLADGLGSGECGG
jgi:hypothetical protein